MPRVEIRWHGRGGQGAVTASQIIAEAAIREGKWAQAFPEFGAERRGAPVRAYTRIDDKPIYTRAPITRPDVIVVLDPSLLALKGITTGLKEGGLIVINTVKSPEEIKKAVNREDVKVAVVNATKIALEILKRPIVNTAILGALVKVTNLVKLESIFEVIKEHFPESIALPNIECVKKAYEEVKVG